MRQFQRTLQVLCLALFTGGCAHTGPNVSQASLAGAATPNPNAVFAVMATWLIEGLAKGDPELRWFSITISNNAPTPVFWDVYKPQSLEFRPARKFEPNPEGVFDSKTRDKGVIIDLKSLRWIGDKQADVEVTVYAGTKAAAGSVYRLVRNSDGWTVWRRYWRWVA